MRYARRITLCLVLFLCSLLPSEGALRVISLYPGHTDNVVALGGEGLLVGVSENDTLNLPRFSQKAGAEALLALQPDIVLTRPLAEQANPHTYKVLAQAGVAVESLEPPAWDNFPDYLRRLAHILGLDPEAGAARLSTLREAIAGEAEKALASGKKAPRVFLEATGKLYTCAPHSWAARLIALAGGINAAADAHPARQGSAVAPWGLERVLKSLEEGLDVYILQRGAMNTATVEDVRARPWADALAGVRVAEIPEAWLSRPSLLGLEQGGRALLKLFYGEGAR